MDKIDFTFTMPGPPKPWQRPRRNHGTGTTFTSPKGFADKRDVWVVANAAMKLAGIKVAAKGVPVLIRVDAYFQLPQSISKRECKRRIAGKYHAQKPDADNLIKLIKDALTGTVWVDDCQVQIEGVHKYWSQAPSRTVVAIKIMGEVVDGCILEGWTLDEGLR